MHLTKIERAGVHRGIRPARLLSFILIHYTHMQLSSWNGVIKSNSQIYCYHAWMCVDCGICPACLDVPCEMPRLVCWMVGPHTSGTRRCVGW